MDIISFFRKVTKLEPTQDQINLLEALTNPAIMKIIVSAGRQTGKTLCCAVAVLWWALEYNSPVRILLVSAQDNWLYDHIRTIFNVNREEFAKEITQEGTFSLVPLHGFETVSGSKVHVRGSTEKNIRGIGVDIVFLDEAAELLRSTVTTALGNLSGNICKIVLLSTPHKTSLFNEIAEDPTKYGYKLFTWSSLNCSWHSKQLIQSKKQLMTSQEWKTDVLGQPLSVSERAFFPNKDISKCIIECEPNREGGLKSSLEVGIDFGYGQPNVTCLTVTEKTYSKRKVIYEKTWKEFNAEDMARVLEGFWHNTTIVKADSMPVEFRGKIEQYNPRLKIHYIDSKAHKDLMLTQLQKRIRLHELTIPNMFIPLIKELERYKKGKRAGDNRVDALALSCYEPATPLTAKATHGKVYFPNP